MAVGYLLDTNVLSEVRKRHGNADVKSWIANALGPTLYVSVLSLGEIRNGIERARDRDQHQALALEKWLARLYHSFYDRIAPITPAVAEEWGRLNAQRTLPSIDGLLAATARVNGWSVVTRNGKDFSGTGIAVINPFEP